MPTIDLRVVRPTDEPLLLRIYTATRADIAALAWDPPQKAEFVEMQFRAQTDDYTARFPHAEHSIVIADGEPVGRIWVDRGPDEIRLLDVALLDDHRNRGTGRALLEQLIAEARRAGVPLRHSVYVDNGDALRFYRRLGFEVVEDHGMYVLMEWTGVSRPAE